MNKDVLIISTMGGAEQCAALIAQQTGTRVEVASSRRAGLSALRRGAFDVIVVDQNLVEGDPEWADLLWQNAGTAMPVQINFSISSSLRLAREVSAALSRRSADKVLARRGAASDMANELKSPLTGLLLQTELALMDPSMTATMEPRLRHLMQLAGVIRERLRADA